MIRIPRGTQDILPEQTKNWQYVEKQLHELCRLYRYDEIRTPIFEHTELFQRGVGDSTDIVQKEMYTFKDRGDRSLTLRPEGTAPVVRAFVENKLYGLPDQPVKLYYLGPIFRYERPQTGRTRQFVQFGVEALGSEDPAIDAEVIALAFRCYKQFGLKKLNVLLNSLGDAEDRRQYREALVAHFRPKIGEFCLDCQKRLETNPLRILDCKVDRNHEWMAKAPSILDTLSAASQSHFAKVKKYLDDFGIPYTVDFRLVRGLDYYTHTCFEIISEADVGANSTLCGGGRYNGLVEELDGPPTPGVGFALSLERLFVALESEGIKLPAQKALDCYVVAIGEEAGQQAAFLLEQLRAAGVSCDKDYMNKKVKGQFKQADRLSARYVAIVGEEELKSDKVTVKHLATGEQREIALSHFVEKMKQLCTEGA